MVGITFERDSTAAETIISVPVTEMVVGFGKEDVRTS